MIKVLNIVGARPNFMKMAPLYRAYQKSGQIQPVLVHTGQHYDYQMSDLFFEELGLPKPDYNLQVGSASHAQQTARVMERLEPILIKEKPDVVLVVGDVNSTLAAALTAKKMGIRVAHVEAGLRSFDRTMPEEINRLLTDQISDWLFISEESGIDNLRREGVADEKIFFVGNVMIDNLIFSLLKIEQSTIKEKIGLKTGEKFIVQTVHRPVNVDSRTSLEKILDIDRQLSQQFKVIFSIHPRTENSIKKNGLWDSFQQLENLIIIPPLSYFDLLSLVKNSFCVLTDSGGIQEEAAYLKTPTVTLRNTTERPATISVGANYLLDLDSSAVLNRIELIQSGQLPSIKDMDLSDGKASERIVYELQKNNLR